ncbi:MAG: flagellar biosynthesis protein FlhB [Candidatus Zixiibacteriota bacterium]|nr:MAG: flagellar biosynthesis protein FlhB [candidate division Zixibacteria bacterium]
MADQGFQERTEKPTTRRRRKAREEGRVAKSMELNSAAILCLGFMTLYMMGPHLAGQVMEVMRHTMTNAPQIALSDPTFISVFSDSMLKFFVILSPVLIIMTLVAIGINVVQVGFKITPKAVELKFDKLNIANGLKRLVSLRSLVQIVRDSVKLFIVGFVAYKVIDSEFESFFLLPDMSVVQFAGVMGKLALTLVLKIGAVILVIAVLDYMYQRYEFEKSIKMSKQDLKDEYKDTEGSPQLKARVRQMQREMARSRMMQAVPTADVVVTNPTEIAVALKYDPSEMDAPTVVAMGERLIAQKIRELAIQHGIPVVEDKPLARALLKMCEVGQVIPANLYKAVAELLAYVYKMKAKVVK